MRNWTSANVRASALGYFVRWFWEEAGGKGRFATALSRIQMPERSCRPSYFRAHTQTHTHRPESCVVHFALGAGERGSGTNRDDRVCV